MNSLERISTLKKIAELIEEWNSLQPANNKVNSEPLIRRLNDMRDTNDLDNFRKSYANFLHVLIERRPLELRNYISDELIRLEQQIATK